VHITYYDGNTGDPKYAYASSPTGSFITEVIDSALISGWYTVIALDSNDKPHAAYYSYTDKKLIYAEKTSETWTVIDVPEAAIILEDLISIDLDSSNLPNIGYSSGGLAKLARFIP